jgi:hypothetical protein
MNGTIIKYDYNIGEGIIRGNDKHIYKFAAQDWRGTVVPVLSQEVDFMVVNERPVAIVDIQNRMTRMQSPHPQY